MVFFKQGQHIFLKTQKDKITQLCRFNYICHALNSSGQMSTGLGQSSRVLVVGIFRMTMLSTNCTPDSGWEHSSGGWPSGYVHSLFLHCGYAYPL